MLGRFTRSLRDTAKVHAEDVHDNAGAAASSGQHGDDADPDVDVDHALVAGPGISEQHLTLMREYLLASLHANQWISFPRRELDEEVIVFAQVLAVESKVTTVDTCRPTHFVKKPFLQVTLQPLEHMLPFDAAAAANIH